MKEIERNRLAGFMDHTLLRPGATLPQVEALCREAVTHGFAAVCIHPYFVAAASKWLDGSDVKVCTVIDFPLGSATSEMKALCARKAVESGAFELDMVMNLSAFRSGAYAEVEDDIRGVVEASSLQAGSVGERSVGTGSRGAIVKVILETCSLSDGEIKTACELAANAGAHFVKTSTGFGTGGATVEAVRIMHETVGTSMGIKASGGIDSYEKARAMIEAGATRIGTSSAIKIISRAAS